MPLRIAKAKQMRMEEVPLDISLVDVQGRKMKIEGMVQVIMLTGDGRRKSIAFIVGDFPRNKEPL